MGATRVVGSYEVEGVLGRGGMGVVYRAHDRRLDRRVALKLLNAQLAEDDRFRERFLRERRAAAAIDHPNVIPVYEAGEADGQLFIATRLVEGEDLDALLRREGALEPARAASLLGQIADALDAIHAHGLVHRDVKPSNVLIHASGAREHAYVTDFGIAKSAADETPLTNTGAFMGTVDYCAPEVIRGDGLDARADVYALGCMLFECLTGEKPFARDTQLAVVYAHLEDPPPSALDRRPGLPPQLDAVITRALAKDPDDRFQSAGALAEAAVAALGEPAVRTAEHPSPRRSRRLPVVLAAVLAVALAAVAVVVLAGGGGDEEAPSSAAPGAAAPTTEGRTVVGSRLSQEAGEAGFCTGDGPGDRCSIVQISLGTADQAVRADGVVTKWSVRGAEGQLALQVVDGEEGRRRVVARGPTVRVPGTGVETFSVRLPVDEGQRLGVELGPDGFLPFRYRDEGASAAEFYLPPLGTRPAQPEPDAGGTSGYEFLYNATVEPDDDRDGRGDLTQDPDHGGAGAECPREGELAKGSGSSVVRVDDQVFGCRGGVRTLVGPTADGVDYPLFRFAGDQLAAVQVRDGRSSILFFDLGDRRRTFATDQTSDDGSPAEWRVSDLVVAPTGNGAWMAAPRGAPDRTAVWTRKGGRVAQADSGELKSGTLRVTPDASGVTYADADGRTRDTSF